MVEFLDGPAVGSKLALARAPLFLRVTVSLSGEVDALDRLGDAPREDEWVYVYFRKAHTGSIHYSGRARDGRRFGRWEQFATYTLHPVQPGADGLRDTEMWREWCVQQVKATKS